ncbi:MAG: SRPBCC family protein [Gemmatimonas sp.]
MFWILLVMGLIVSLIVAMVVGGLVTPRTHVTGRVMQLQASPDTVWEKVSNVRGYPDWRDDVMSVDARTDQQGVLTWTEIGSKSLSYAAVTNDPPHRFTSRITDEDLGYSGEWRFVLTPSGTGTRLTITEHGDVPNPVMRFIGSLIGHAGSIERYMRHLALSLGERASPEPLNT